MEVFEAPPLYCNVVQSTFPVDCTSPLFQGKFGQATQYKRSFWLKFDPLSSGAKTLAHLVLND